MILAVIIMTMTTTMLMMIVVVIMMMMMTMTVVVTMLLCPVSRENVQDQRLSGCPVADQLCRRFVESLHVNE